MRVVCASDTELAALGLSAVTIRELVDAFQRWSGHLTAQAGLQLAVVADHRLALSLCAGREAWSGRHIERDTLFPILSATKGVSSIVLLHLHALGYFEWDDRIARFWPRFAANGKAEGTVAHLLSHRLGIPEVTAPWDRWPDRAFMVELIESAHPKWPPGEKYGYHGGSWGVVVDELVRRWTSCETGEVLRDALVPATGASNCFLGLPRHRYEDVARLLYVESDQVSDTSLFGPIGADQGYNSWDVLRTCQSSGGCVASAEGLATLYSAIAGNGRTTRARVWSAREQREATAVQSQPRDGAPAARPELRFAWGMGFMVSPSEQVFGTTPLSGRTAGHPGASGAVGYADPRSGISVALTINGVGGGQMYSRYRELGDLLRRARDRARTPTPPSGDAQL